MFFMILLFSFVFIATTNIVAIAQPTTRETPRVSGSSKPTTRPSKLSRTVRKYLPLKLGNSWTYLVMFTDVQTFRRVVRIVKRKGHIFFDNTGNYLFYNYLGVECPPFYLLKYPLIVGHCWLSKHKVISEILKINIKIKVPAGVFANSLVVRYSKKTGKGKVIEADVFYAPNVGIVKVVEYIKEDRKRKLMSTFQLESFTLK